jgi:ribonuclease HI
LAIYKDGTTDPIHEECDYTGSATVFQAEVYAIEMACEYATQQACPLVTILSDSLAAILALTSPYITSRTVLRTLHALTKLTQTGATVQIRWIRGHNGSQGNETADLLANLGAASMANGPEPFVPFSQATIKAVAREDLHWTE